MSKILIKLNDESDRVQITFTKKEGTEVKYVSLDDLVAAFTEFTAETEYMDVTLPEHCVKASINRKGSRIAEFVIPGRRRTFFYYGDEYVIPMPTLHFKLKSSGKNEGWVWVEEKDKKYLYPFGNVGVDNHICFGGNKLEKINDFSDFIYWIEAFFASKTNDDYYGQKEVVTEDGEELSQRELLYRIQDMETYPEKWLKPITGGDV
jgi:hypothetical protein